MEIRLARPLIKRIWRAVIEFEMLQSGDRVLVGVSGGKDSAFLLYAMQVLKKSAPFPLEIAALHIDLGFGADAVERLENFCRRLEVKFFSEKTQIAQMALNHRSQNPCAQCAFFRRGAINKLAVEKGYTKVAYAHHLDDAVVTFLMSQLYSGHLRTFLPKTQLERSGITVIRPLIYIREYEIKRALKDIPFTPVESLCPLEGKSKRAEVGELIHQLTQKNRYVFTNLAAALRQGHHVELWPRQLTKAEMRERHRKVMGGSLQGESEDEVQP